MLPMLSAILLLLSAGPVLAASLPGSGDVDDDGRLTTRDAVLILQNYSAPEMTRLHEMRLACDFNHDGACNADDAYAILAAVITDYADVDGDGVPNEQDCNPFDERLSTPHTYYLDMDRDSFGDSNNSVTACTLSPPAPSVAWGGDPRDDTPFEILQPVPKGIRRLGLDFLDPAADARWRDDLAREIGVDAATLRLTWSAIESAPGVYSGSQTSAIDIIDSIIGAEGFDVSLTLGPAAGGRLVVPPDLEGPIAQGALRLSDPVVIDRFNALLTFVHSRLPHTTLAALFVGQDVDTFLARAPLHFWADYGVFFSAVSAHAKALWGPQLKVGFTATHAGLVSGQTASLLQSLNSLADVVGVSYLPRRADRGAIQPSAVRLDVQQLIARYYPKPIVFDAVAYPSSPMLGSSTTQQSQFLRAFFHVWDEYADLIPAASFSRLHDVSLERARFEAMAEGGDLRLGTAYLQSIGLRTWDGAGAHKPAYRTLRDLAGERGWWRIPPATTRSFGLGFTPALYDFPTTLSEYGAMLDWIQNTIATDATTVNLHLDSGVPWVEALADTFASPDLPYSPALQAAWASLRAHIPPGKQVLVSVNPLGVPRNVIAPYYGVGEGFTYDAQFVRVGDGIIRDAENRLPPPPWNTYRLDHPDVKRAFLNYCRRAIQYFHPDHLVMAIEVTATLNEDPAVYDDLLELLRFVRGGLKGDPATAALPLAVSISATTFMTDEYGVPFKYEDQPGLKRALQLQGLSDALPLVDFVALSLYPHYGKYNASTMPSSMFEELMPVLEQTGKPFVVSETGWPAETYTVLDVPFFSDAAKQDRFYKLLFYELEKTPAPVDFVVSYQPRDSDWGWARLVQGSLQNPPTVSPMFVEFYKYFRDIGIYDGDGGSRPATETWRRELALPYVRKP